MTAVPTIPNANNPKGIPVYDLKGGQEYIIPVTIGANNAFDTGTALLVSGLGATTAGVTDTTDKRFVTDAELANIVTLGPLAALEAQLAIVGASLSETLLASAAAVDLNTATASTIFTVPTGKSAVITKFVIRLASTSLTTVSFSIGYESTTFANVLANATHTELTGNTLYTVLLAKTGAKVGTTTQLLKLLCNTLQGGSASATVDTYGYVY